MAFLRSSWVTLLVPDGEAEHLTIISHLRDSAMQMNWHSSYDFGHAVEVMISTLIMNSLNMFIGNLKCMFWIYTNTKITWTSFLGWNQSRSTLNKVLVMVIPNISWNQRKIQVGFFNSKNLTWNHSRFPLNQFLVKLIPNISWNQRKIQVGFFNLKNFTWNHSRSPLHWTTFWFGFT